MKQKNQLLLFTVLFLLLSKSADARVLPRFKNISKTATKVVSGFTVLPKLRADRRALIVYFNNLNKVSNASYTLMYQTNGKEEGVSGSITSIGNSASRELLFGTCSSGVCRYHNNITNMKLEVNYELPSNKRFLKRFRIRV